MSALGRLAASELAALPRGIGDVHDAISSRVFGALGPIGAPVRVVHDAIARGTYEAVGGGLWLGATAAAPMLDADPESKRGAVILAALNGLIGDRLAAQGSELAIPMQVRSAGEPGPDVAVFLHGLGETEHAWGSRHYGDQLDGWTPVFVRYNTGRHISENGAALGGLLDQLVAEWPVQLARIALVGHSMGGLVARSACHHGGDWTARVSHLVSLGSPHTGAPLEQAVHGLTAALQLAPETRPFARFLRRRSAGIRDLRRGLDLPAFPSARHHFIAATVTSRPGHPVGRVIGDTLVLEASASYGDDGGETLGGLHHLALLNHPEVAERLRRWLA
jgi:pimeloyl-ACP methyl ester carboxylesterase